MVSWPLARIGLHTSMDMVRSRTLSPVEAIKLKQCESGFSYKIVNGGVSLTENHTHYYQVQMQMAVTSLTQCNLVIFTSLFHISEAPVKHVILFLAVNNYTSEKCTKMANY